MGLFLIGGHWPKILPQNKKGASEICVLCICTLYGVLFSPLWLKFVRAAGNFSQKLTTVKSGAYDMVWLNLWYFTASWQGGGKGEGALSSQYHYAPLDTHTHITVNCNLENIPFGIRVVNLLPDPDTGWMWIQLGHWIRIQEGNGVQKKDYYFF